MIFSAVWILMAMLFSGVIYWLFDHGTGGLEYFSRFQAAYWVEKALSVDNLFVFILIFSFFKIPAQYQHKVLFYGILGAIVFRAIFIFAGVELIHLTYIPQTFLQLPGQISALNPILLIFGVFLLIAGIKSGLPEKQEVKELSDGWMYKLIKKRWNLTPNLHGDKFIVLEEGVKKLTPLLVALIIIELTDIVFAMDSIPAIFAIAPDNPFILYTSNIFAILGLRSLYFLLANSMSLFSKLHYGLAGILSFIGIKMIIMPFYHVPIKYSLLLILGILVLTIARSLLSKQKKG